MTNSKVARPEMFADLASIRAGGKRVIARLIGVLESTSTPDWCDQILDEAAAAPTAQVLGLTGPPGVGKSTLTRALIAAFRARGERVAVVAVDPSSRLTGGALLGDRARMKSDPADHGLIIRSLAARDRLGGLSDNAIAIGVLFRALFDRVIVETVGVGQSEADVTLIADLVVLCVQPGSGDSLQFMKAGIMEVPDIVCVTKADMTREAQRARADVEGALSLAVPSAHSASPSVLLVSAANDLGIQSLTDAIDTRWQERNKSGALTRQRQRQSIDWINEAVSINYGRDGLQRVDPIELLKTAPGPFTAIRAAAQQIENDRNS